MKFAQVLDVDGSRESIFDLTQDYDRRLEWDPFLQDARLLSGAVTPEKGVRALCTDRRGNAMEVVYVAYDRPSVAAVKMTRGPVFLQSFAGTWRFSDAGDGRTRVLFKYFYRIRWPFGALAAPIARAFANETAERLIALRDFVKTGATPANGV